MIQFECKECGRRMKAADEMAGKAGKCPQCGTQNTVPAGKPDIQEQAAEITTQEGEDRDRVDMMERKLASMRALTLAALLVAGVAMVGVVAMVAFRGNEEARKHKPLSQEARAHVEEQLAALEYGDGNARRRAVQYFSTVPAAAVHAIPSLVNALGDPDLGVAMPASMALRNLGDDLIDALPYLIETLTSGTERAQGLALDLLILMGEEARSAAPAIRAHAESDDSALAHRALSALKVIAPEEAHALKQDEKTETKRR